MDQYNRIVQYLEQFIPDLEHRFPREFGLERMQQFRHLLGNPHLSYATVHVVGTSGKGSTAAFLASILSAGGFKTGLTVSPHLQVINERLQINGKMVSVAQLDVLVKTIQPYIEIMRVSSWGTPSYFEILLALAFLYFSEQKVDIAVVEAGLGGMYDGTNVMKPILGIITNIGLDHMEVLGPNVEAIARDKAGIIKEGMKVVTGASQTSVLKIITGFCKKQHVPCYIKGKDFSAQPHTATLQGTSFSFTDKNKNLANLVVSLIGMHQIGNATLAVEAALLLGEDGYRVSDEAIHTGLQTAFLPGRFEFIQQYPPIILDGAHNPDKMLTTVEAMKLLPKERTVMIFAAKKDKNIAEMFHMLFPNIQQLILTEFSFTTDLGMHMCMPAVEMKRIAFSQATRTNWTRAKTFVVSEPKLALRLAKESAGSNGQIVISGSLFLAGQLRDAWYKREDILQSRVAKP